MVPLEPRRRAVVLALAGILAGFAFETGVHSAHHLGHEDGGAACAVASATGRLPGAPVKTATTDRVMLPSSELPDADRRSTLDVHPLGAHRGRAPPILV